MAGTSNRGFASMDAAKQREIASKGGKAAHQKGTAHQFTSEEARRAGSKGGRAARQKRAQAAGVTPHLVIHSGETADEGTGSTRERDMSPQSEVRRPDHSDNESGHTHDQVSNG